MGSRCAGKRDQLFRELAVGDAVKPDLLVAGVEVELKGARDLMHLKIYAVD